MFFCKLFLLSFILSISLSSVGTAHVHWSRPDGHGPLGVMGDHTHKAGEWMFSYRYMNMFMDGNKSGTSDISTSQVLSQFMVTPTRMKMEMHMAGAMVAFSDKVTVMAMAPFIRYSMDHVNRMGRTFNTETRGLGDLKLTGLIVLMGTDGHHLHANAGVSLPTGSIDERDDTLMPDQLLPYPMQLGSGTLDLLPGLTYVGQVENWSWGAQGIATLRLGENSRDYTLGNRFNASIWGARKLTRWLSASTRFAGETWGDIDGRDNALNQNMVPTADSKRRAGDRIDFLVGVNIYKREGFLAGHRIAIEVGQPMYERLDGPQLQTETILILGWQKAF